MKFSLLLVFSMALLKSLAMPVQATISEDSLMVSQNNAYGNQKFRLKVLRKKLVTFKMEYFLEHECESLNSYLNQGMRYDFGFAGAGASWRALGLKTAGAHSTRG